MSRPSIFARPFSREAAKAFLFENKDIAGEIRRHVLGDRAAIAEKQSSSAKGEPTSGGGDTA